MTSLLLYNNDRAEGRGADNKRIVKGIIEMHFHSQHFPRFSSLFQCGYLGGSEPISTDPIRSDPIRDTQSAVVFKGIYLVVYFPSFFFTWTAHECPYSPLFTLFDLLTLVAGFLNNTTCVHNSLDGNCSGCHNTTKLKIVLSFMFASPSLSLLPYSFRNLILISISLIEVYCKCKIFKKIISNIIVFTGFKFLRFYWKMLMNTVIK